MTGVLGATIGSGNFSLPITNGLMLWLDASDASTITSSSGSVSEWRDKSSNSWHVSQATSADQPKIGLELINNKNVITFNNSSQILLNSSNNLFQNVQYEEIFIAINFCIYKFGFILLPDTNCPALLNITGSRKAP
jgi:hypothetical protein